MLRIAKSHRIALSLGSAIFLGLSTAHAQTAVQLNSIAEPQTARKPAVLSAMRTGGSNALVAGYGVRGLGGSDVPPLVGAPFSAVSKSENITKLVDGNRIVQSSTAHLYRDNQGRTRTEHAFPTPARSGVPLPAMIHISDPISGESYMLNAQSKTASLFPFPVKSPPVQSPVKAPPVSPQLTLPSFSYGLGGAPDKNSKQTDLGEKTIEGVRTVGSRVEYTLPAGEIGNEKPIVITAEQWFSPDLGVVVASVQHSTAGNESTYKLEQIQREEQDRELFSVPSDYTKQDVNSQGVFRMQSAPATAAPPPPPQ